MLSKVFYEKDSSNKLDINELISNLLLYFSQKYSGKKIDIINCQPGGTLGIFFHLYIDGKKYFIKTHIPNKENHLNMLKEYELLSILYKKEMYIDYVNIIINGMEQFFLIIDILYPIANSNPLCINNAINDYNTKLSNIQNGLIKSEFSFNQIYSLSQDSLNYLYENNHITKTLLDKCNISFLKADLLEMKLDTFCHGDLSSKNILQKDGCLIVIDWEDSFWGYKDYDICYWLTFYEQRKYYTEPFLLRDLGIGYYKGIATMIAITLIKCYMSCRDGSVLTNKLSISTRINEIFRITN